MAHPLAEWNTGLFDCCEDINSCCYGFWCCCCLACDLSDKFGENRCLPVCDICSPAILCSSCGIPLCVPPAGLALRVAIRHRYGLEGSLCKDIATACVCVWCNWCQMDRELKQRAQNKTLVVDMQPAPVRTAPADPPPSGQYTGMILASY
ncbi:cornifelin homolog B-like [Solea solea]|uniref:cornifelin homolog B-like n=1 Tax=Solea solea TaxID=90069 RepID=UPI00272C6EF1|nr:cornifelin homolog B-like [Solea solea]